MKKQIIAGNWKMNSDLEEGSALINEIVASLQANPPKKEADNIEVIICPPFIHLPLSAELTQKLSFIKTGAQNCSEHEKGAYTGEISAQMIRSTGAEYVILGHSERRQYHNEDDNLIYKKLLLALQEKLTPIYCCGEQLNERESGKHFEVVENQLKNSIFKLDHNKMQNVIIAYEPVWAIGTGKVATPEQAQEMHNFIREKISHKFGADLAGQVSILYGGSCKPDNAEGLFKKPDIDGGLIGGASLKANDFIQIIHKI